MKHYKPTKHPKNKNKSEAKQTNKTTNTPLRISLSSFSVGHSLLVMGHDINSDLYTQ